MLGVAYAMLSFCGSPGNYVEEDRPLVECGLFPFYNPHDDYIYIG